MMASALRVVTALEADVLYYTAIMSLLLYTEHAVSGKRKTVPLRHEYITLFLIILLDTVWLKYTIQYTVHVLKNK